MIKKNMGKLLIGSVIILLPIVAGLILWDRLPGTLASHWNANGEADGFAGKSMMVFLMPLILLAFQWLCVLATAADPKNKNQSQKAFNLVLWILPVFSIVVSAVTYGIALGVEVNLERIEAAVIGLMFIVIGNYLPKCRVNHTIGIKLPWTINDEEIWNKTHRFASWFWVVGGVLLFFAALLPLKWMVSVMIAVILLLAVIPTIYSYVLYKKKGVRISYTVNKNTSVFIKISIALTAVVLIVAAVLMFTGDVNVECKDEVFAVKATYWENIEVSYDKVDSIEFRDSFDGGERTNGFGGPRVLYGTFRNDEFGYYTRYTYTKNNGYIILDVDGKMLVLGLGDKEATQELYKELSEKIG